MGGALKPAHFLSIIGIAENKMEFFLFGIDSSEIAHLSDSMSERFLESPQISIPFFAGVDPFNPRSG
jgi:hypothetical protein